MERPKWCQHTGTTDTHCSIPRVGNPAFLEHIHVHASILYDCFHATMAELSNWPYDQQSQNSYCLALYSKSLPIPGSTPNWVEKTSEQFTTHTWCSDRQNFYRWKLNPSLKSQRNHLTGLLWHFALSQREKEIKTVILFNRKYSTPTWSPSWNSDTEQLQSFRAKQALHHVRRWTSVGSQRKPPTHRAAASNKKLDRGSQVTLRHSSNLFPLLSNALHPTFLKTHTTNMTCKDSCTYSFDILKSLKEKFQRPLLAKENEVRWDKFKIFQLL